MPALTRIPFPSAAALVIALATLCACAPEAPVPESTIRDLILGDGTVIRHGWDDAGPVPARNDWVNVEVAGYLLSESDDVEGYAWTWTFTLRLRHAEVDLVAVSDVTGPESSPLVTMGAGVIRGDKWLAQSDSVPVDTAHLPWLFSEGESLRILRFSIADLRGDTRILYQPVLFSQEGKRRLLSITGPARGLRSGN